MNRRDLLRAMLGAAATTALPSEIWPFRKIFLPASVSPIIVLPPITPIGSEYLSLGIVKDITIQYVYKAFNGLGQEHLVKAEQVIKLADGRAYFKPYRVDPKVILP